MQIFHKTFPVCHLSLKKAECNFFSFQMAVYGWAGVDDYHHSLLGWGKDIRRMLWMTRSEEFFVNIKMLAYILLIALASHAHGGKKQKQEDPLTLSCANVLCPEKLVCVYGPTGPTCGKPGQCPGYRLDIVGICKRECRFDHDCEGEKKCCFNGCTNRCFAPILINTIVTCATMKCAAGYVCNDYPSGGSCEPDERPGTCPEQACGRIPANCKGKDECSVDSDCKGQNRKCCKTCDGCMQCVERSAPSSCDNMFCAVDTACVEEKSGAKCVKDLPKSGHCPLSTCKLPVEQQVCPDRAACVSDVQCKGDHKCCKDCQGCGTCVEPAQPPSCKDKKCKEGEVCVMDWVPCNTPPCPLEPKCDKPCLLPKEEGMCVDRIKSYYYDLARMKCLRFFYGGCEGNNNRFASKKECQKACMKNVQCPEGGPEPPCQQVNECALSPKGTKPLCPAGKACCPTPCGTRCRKPLY